MVIKWDLAFGAGGSHVPCGTSASGSRDRRGYFSAEKHACGHYLLLASPAPPPPKAACRLPCPPEERGLAESCAVLLQCHIAFATVH